MGLRHRAGARNPDNAEARDAVLDASPKSPPVPRKLISHVEDEPLNFQPGSEYRYSNTDNVTVGPMVQVATGDSYERQLREQVLRPLGLQKTGLPRGANLKPPYIHGYDNVVSRLPPEDISEALASGWVWASGGMVSTPYDFNDFARLRRVVPGGSSEAPGPGKNSAGLCIFRYEARCSTVWGHTGKTTRATRSSWPQAPTASAP